MNNRDFERERIALAEELYLNYLNNYLYNAGAISKAAHDRMTVEIIRRKPLPKKQKTQSYEMEM